MDAVILSIMVALPLFGLVSLLLMLDRRTNPAPIPVKYGSRRRQDLV